MPAPKAAKKVAKPVVKKGQQRYEYVDLAKVSLTSSEPQNVYGVIVDATFPHKVNQEKYVTSLKIIDPTLHAKGSKGGGNDDYAQVVIYGKRFEDLPIASKVGDIIRLHRAAVRIYNHKRQFNVSTHWNGSWALFSTESSANEPSSYSGNRATFESHEKALLGSLRKWVGSHFHANDAVTKDKFVTLDKATKQKGDFDVVAKVVSIHEMDEYTNELRLCDGSSSWYTLALKLKFPDVRAGQVVRIRSATHDESTSSKNVLALSHYSNIMTFVNSSKQANELAKKVSDDWKRDQAELNKAVPSHAIVLSEVEKKHANLAQSSLQDMFHHADKCANTVRATFSVVKVEGAVADLVRVYDKKSKKSSSAKGAKGGDLFWQASLLVKDASTAENSNKYRVLVQSHEGLGANFFGKAANLHSDKAALAKVEKQVANLTKFNTFVDAVCERRNNMWLIKDTKLRC